MKINEISSYFWQNKNSISTCMYFRLKKNSKLMSKLFKWFKIPTGIPIFFLHSQVTEDLKAFLKSRVNAQYEGSVSTGDAFSLGLDVAQIQVKLQLRVQVLRLERVEAYM